MFGFIGACIGAVCSCIGSAFSCCAAAASSIFSGITSVAKGVLNIIGELPMPKIEDVLRMIDTVCRVIDAICKILGVENEDEPEELGYKASLSDKTPEDFESVQEYIKHLNKEIEFDRANFEKLSKEEKAAYKSVGTALEVRAAEEKLGINVPVEVLGATAKLIHAGWTIDPKFAAESVLKLKSAGVTDLGDVVDYLKGQGESDRIKTGGILKEVFGAEAGDIIEKLKDDMRN